MKHTPLLASALLALAPVLVLTVPGCGGGNGSNPVPTTTPTQTSTATPTATTTATTSPTNTPAQTSNFTLQNGQRAILTTHVTGTAINGTIEILASTATRAVKPRAIPFQIAPGTYNISGTVTPPRGYQVSGSFGEFLGFSMTGQLPTTTEAGSYTISLKSLFDSGVLPILGQPFPTPTPVV